MKFSAFYVLSGFCAASAINGIYAIEMQITLFVFALGLVIVGAIFEAANPPS